MAHKDGYTAISSHRSGETEDTTIADLAVALNTCNQLLSQTIWFLFFSSGTVRKDSPVCVSLNSSENFFEILQHFPLPICI